jgi:hypothetical protein
MCCCSLLHRHSQLQKLHLSVQVQLLQLRLPMRQTAAAHASDSSCDSLHRQTTSLCSRCVVHVSADGVLR